MTDESIFEALDACRPGDGKLNERDLSERELRTLAEALQHDPELRALFDRVQDFDARVSAALGDVPVPAGLKDRILLQLAVESPSLATNTSAADKAQTPLSLYPGDELSSESSEVVQTRTRRLLRLRDRRSWAIAASLVAAAVLMVIWLRPVGEYRHDDVVGEARAIFESSPAGTGKLLKKDFVISPQLATLPGSRWRAIDGFLGRSGFAYDLRTPAGVRGLLLVVKLLAPPRTALIDTAGLPQQPRPFNSGSGGLTTAMWREQGKLFVLLVDGDERAFQQFLPSRPTVARRRPASNAGAIATGAAVTESATARHRAA